MIANSFQNQRTKAILLIFAIFFSQQSFADQRTELEQDLKQVQQSLKQQRYQENRLLQELSDTELALGQVKREVGRLKRKIRKNHQDITSAQKSLAEQSRNVANLKVQLKQQLRFNFVQSKQHPLKWLLDQSDSADKRQRLKMQQYLTKSQLQYLSNYHKAAKKLDHDQQNLAQRNAKIRRLINEHNQQKNRLEANLKTRQRLVGSLQQQLRANDSRAQHLQASLEELNTVIGTINRHKSFRHLPRAFNTYKGHLPWPVASNKAAIKKHHAGLNYTNGSFISCKAGSTIRAVADGTVIFADWLRGYGLLLILDHGNGYLSLYGQNQNFYKKVGDKVKHGDVIAKAGTSGGQNQAGLYFELRKDGKALTVSDWLEPKTHA